GPRNGGDPVSPSREASGTGEATRIEPPVSEAATPFWEATRPRQLHLPWCNQCNKAFWYPRVGCPNCLSDDLGWRPASGKGTVHACSVMAKPAFSIMASRVPYVVALVGLEAGPRVMPNIL